MLKIKITIFVCILCLLQSIEAQRSANCIRSCGQHQVKNLPSPFGFSGDCQIPLNCSGAGEIFINEFKVRSFSSDNIMVNLPASCGRPINSLRRLFGRNYAPTTHNGILLQNCTSPVTVCLIPTTMIQTRFENTDCEQWRNQKICYGPDCGSKNNNSISCYSEQNKTNLFMDYLNLMRSGCESLFSAISTLSLGNSSAVSLNVEVVQLEWWVEGNCENCSNYATCVRIVAPFNGTDGYRCRCLSGFVGDGYRGGSGCRKESSSCNPSKFLSGRCGGTTRVGVLIGGISVGASLIIGIALICCFIRKRAISKTKSKTKQQLSEAIGIDIAIYPYKEIEKATSNFSEKQRLGTGAYGTVYSGKLHNDKWVAIKRIKHRANTDNIEQVINEIKLISSVNHPNLVRLLGCSIDKGEQVLIYEYMPNGTLSQHLQKERGNGLPWPIRVTIASETAQAIAYLHSSMDPPIYHRDIKSSNILLDYNYKTKIADFGLSRLGRTELSHVSTAPQGTPGYLDPQYHQNFHLSDKTDVYSFGVVLVEIITGLKAVDFSRPPNEVILASLAVDRIGKGRLDTIIDPFFESNKDIWTVSSLHKVAELAFRCLAFQSDARPSMMEVAVELEQIMLSKWASFSSETVANSLGVSSCTSLSDEYNKSLDSTVDKCELFGSVKSMESMKDLSLVSVDNLWPSDESSPSSNSLLNHVIH
ncbi:hypothetical protein LguiA_003752 [Lonicera macranthoides]